MTVEHGVQRVPGISLTQVCADEPGVTNVCGIATSGENPLDRLSVHCTEMPLPEPFKRGVYILIHDGEIVYIGQSTNIFGRIGMHVSKFDFDRILWIPVDASPDRMAVEGALIRRFNPRHSRRCSKKYINQDADILARFGLEPDPVAAAESKRRNDECFPLAGRIRRQRDNCWRHAFKKAKRNGKSELAATRAANRAVRLLDERLAATTA